MRKLSTDLIKSGSFTGSFSGSVIGTITSASFASTASYLLNSFSLNTGSSYPITSSWSNKSITSSYSITSSNLSPVAQDLIPISNSLYNLGSPTNKWKDLYVSTGSIYIGDTVLSTSGSTLYTNTSPVVTLNTASGQIEISGISASLSASYATNAGLLNNTSSTIFATTGSNNFNGNQTVQGNITIVGSLTAQQYVVSSSVSYFTSSNFDGSTKFGDTDSDTHQFTGSLRSPNITGSLLGTSSFSNNSTSASYSSTSSVALNALTSSYINVATNAVSSSYASTASISVSSSFATTSSYNLNSISSSYSLTASFAANAGSSLTTGSTYPITASWSNNSISSSYSTFAVSSNSATSANTATSASYATVAGSSTSATTANSATSASYSLTSSYSINSTTATSSSFASTASYNLNSISSSFSVNSLTASYIVNSISSSYALTASYALNAGSGGGSSSTSSLIGQTFVPTASVSQLSLTQSVSNNDQILVILDGLVQSRTGSYTVSGSTLTLTENADSGSNIDVRFLGGSTSGGSSVSSSYALTSSFSSTSAPRTAIYRYGTTSIVNPGGYADTIIKYDTAVIDTTSWYNNSNGRFTPDVAGWYMVCGSARVYGGSSTAEGYLGLFKNGVRIVSNGGLGFVQGSISFLVYFNGSTDYVQFYSNTSTAITNGAASTTTSFTMVYMTS
jgi:hypothetical protein